MAGFRLFLILAAIAGLTGCETVNGAMTDMKGAFSRLGGGNEVAAAPAEEPLIAAYGVDCPRVGVVEDLNSLTQLSDESGKLGTEISSARMASVQSQCAINDKNVIVDMDIMFEGRMGPKGRVKPDDMPSFSYPYFIAITTPSGSITAKEVFTATVAYEANQDTMNHAEQIRQVIPLTGEYNPSDFEILVGFQLSPAELAYNRANPAAASTVRNLPPAPAAAPAPVDNVSAEVITPAADTAPVAPQPAPASAETNIPSPPPAENMPSMDEAYIPAPVAPPAAVTTEVPQPQVDDVTPVAVAPLYPPTVGAAPPPPVSAPSQKVVPRVKDDTEY